MVTAQLDGLSAAAAGRRLDLSPATVRALCKKGLLRYTWTSLGRLIDSESVEQLRQERAGTKKEGTAR